MKYDLATYLLTGIGNSSYLITFFLLCFRGRWRRWPSIMAFTAIQMTSSIILAASQSNYSRYFYTYWISGVIAFLLMFWILSDVARNTAALPLLVRSRISQFLLGSMLLLSLAGFAGCVSGSGAFDVRLIRSVLIVDRGANLALLIFIVTCSAVAVWVGFHFPRHSLLALVAVGLREFALLAANYLIAFNTQIAHNIANYVTMAAEIGCALLWLVAVVKPQSSFPTYLPPTTRPAGNNGYDAL